MDEFVAYLRDNGNPGLMVDRRPDEENRSSSDIDAIAGTFAIEHTSLDTLPNQRRDDHRFMQVVGSLEEEFGPILTSRIRVIIPYDGVVPGQIWDSVREALRRWLMLDAEALPEGESIVEDIPGIPFRMHVWKASDRPPGLSVVRPKPDDGTLASRAKELTNRKASKLAKYKDAGCTTILLIENNDYALMSNEKMLQATASAFPAGLPPEVDQLWYADTSTPPEVDFYDFTLDVQALAEGQRPR